MSKRAPNPALPAAIDASPEFPKGHTELRPYLRMTPQPNK